MDGIEKIAVVSFDLYGTLVNRMVSPPSRVFQILERRYCDLYGEKIDNFYKKRMDAERRLYKKGEKYVNLGKIYANIDGISDEDRKRCIHLEERIEYDLAYPNKKGVDLFKFFQSKGKKIVVISDMYLPQGLIVRILRKCGIENVSHIYISGREGCSKGDRGVLFLKVCKELGISPEEMIHIGDNLKSDAVNARLNRIHNIYMKPDDMRPIEAYIKNTIHVCRGADEKIGYAYFGPLTMAYVSWIYSKCKEMGIHLLYFFSREGWILKRVFDSVYGDEIKTKYLYVSRKSLSVPQLKTCTCFQDVKEVIYLDNPTMKITRMLGKMGIDSEGLRKCLIENGFGLDEELRNVRNVDFLFELIRGKMKEESARQSDNLIEYLSREIDTNEPVAGIVDIGWTGMMQHNFVKAMQMCGCNQDIRGFFIGQREGIKKYLDAGMSNEGFLFQYDESNPRDIFISGGSLLEMVYTAPHGTTIGYDRNGPILDDNDMPEYMQKHILSIHKGIIKFTNQISKLQIKYDIIDRGQIIAQMTDLFKNPPLNFLDYIGEWTTSDDLPVKMAHKLQGHSLKEFCHELFFNTAWYVGFLKRNFRFAFPYYGVVQSMRKARKLYHVLNQGRVRHRAV